MAESLSRKERVDWSLAGREVDRPPVSFWYHFGTQHLGGEVVADLSIRFVEYYDVDFLKLMNDYFYPMPEGVTEIARPEDLAKIRRFDIHRSPWAEQLKAIDILAAKYRGRMHFIDTVFDPWQCLLRNLVGEHLPELVEKAPEAVLEALEVVTDNVLEYCRESLRRGSSGIFLSTFGAAKQMPRDTYNRFAFPFVERIFRETRDLAVMNTAHIHDYGIYMEEAVKLPVQVISYEDTDPSNPSMPEFRKVWKGSIMAGMDKNRVTRVTPAEAARNAEQGIRNGGKTRFFLAPGCSFPTWMYPEAGRMVVEAAKRAARH